MKILTFLFIIIIVSSLFIMGCKDDAVTPPPVAINEFNALTEYLEGAGGDYLNTTAPVIIEAIDVYNGLDSVGTSQTVVDIRAAGDFTSKRIKWAKNTTLANLRKFVDSLNTQTAIPAKIVLVCYSGQTSQYGASLMRILGHANVTSMKYGMSAWDSSLAHNYWWTKRSNTRAAQFVQDTVAKAAIGATPTLNTGKTTGRDILISRVDTLLKRGFTEATVSEATAYGNPNGYYIANYWSMTDYITLGHIQGAKQYTPKADLKLATYLKTLPIDKPVVIYCWTGQTSAAVASVLRVMGYDAKSLTYGANSMIYDVLLGAGKTTFKRTDIKDLPTVSG
jgi:rhodanese-related sulfurtransferase